MPVITSIEKQKNNPHRFSIFVDGKYSFSINDELFLRLNLRAKQYIDTAQISEIIKEDDFRRALDSAFRFISKREHSIKELKDKLERKKHSDETIDRVLEYLNSKKYLDDDKFATLWVENKIKTKPAGKYLLESELQKKGIKKEIVEKVIKNIYNQYPEIELAKTVMQRKIKNLKQLSEEKRRQRLLSFLQSRGFSYDVIRKVLKYEV